ncbi:DUF2637 domain-containing protein [Streptomyces sp. NPDC050211]|uniref:DUF2637 domain-containing protein n=1 Tax=Streptomyces sp. NPDC050211 TaxID=3154932 RepID=UPI00343B1308
MCNGPGGGEGAMTRPGEGMEARPAGRSALGPDALVRLLRGLVVAAVAAYASYVHQRHFVLQGGADPVTAVLWPLPVDGLLLATADLLKPAQEEGRRSRCCCRSNCWCTGHWAIRVMVSRTKWTMWLCRRAADPLLEQARQVDAKYREAHQRPVSGETPRKQLHVGAERSRRLVALVREEPNDRPVDPRTSAYEKPSARSGLLTARHAPVGG